MKTDNSKKTRRFIQKGILLWVIIILIFLSINFLTQIFGDIPVNNSEGGYFSQLNGIIFYMLIVMIPIILILSVVLLYAQKLINKLAKFYKHKKDS